jgi:hypothetical protein
VVPYQKPIKIKTMSEQTKTVETKVETAVAQPKTEETSSQNTQEVDYEAELAKKDAEIAQIRVEKDNYRKGLLKAKGKLHDEDDTSSNEDEDIDAKIDRKVQERLLSTREAQIQSEKDALVKASAKKIKELTLALKNRGQISTTSGQGSNEDRQEVKTDKYFSPEQIADLKKRGWSDEKIETAKKNMIKGADVPK